MEHVPYVVDDTYLQYLIEKYNIDYVVHGDDPCIVNGKNAYDSAIKMGMHVCMCMNSCMYVCMYVWIQVCMNSCYKMSYITYSVCFERVCKYVCIYVSMYLLRISLLLLFFRKIFDDSSHRRNLHHRHRWPHAFGSPSIRSTYIHSRLYLCMGRPCYEYSYLYTYIWTF